MLIVMIIIYINRLSHLGAVQVSCDRSRGEGGYPKCSLSLIRGEGDTVNDHSIMIMHWRGGGRSHNDHSISLLFFGLELQ